jgi:hypothetical protein
MPEPRTPDSEWRNDSFENEHDDEDEYDWRRKRKRDRSISEVLKFIDGTFRSLIQISTDPRTPNADSEWRNDSFENEHDDDVSTEALAKAGDEYDWRRSAKNGEP